MATLLHFSERPVEMYVQFGLNSKCSSVAHLSC